MNQTNEPVEVKAKPKTSLLLTVFILVLLVLVLFLSSGQTPQTYLSEINQSCAKYDPSNSLQVRTVNYKELVKNSEKFKGTFTQFSGEVLQIQEVENGGVMRLATAENLENPIYVIYKGSTNILQGDTVKVTGELAGDYEYSSVANYNLTIPKLVGCKLIRQ